MGVSSFWPTFGGEGECVNLFQIASDHFKRTHKPYRIAVDTPYWLFKNLDEESVEEIRKQSKRASNPNEKANLYRLMRYACHGIQVCLVFDGKGRPTKRGKTLTAASHRLVDEKMGLLKEAAQELGVAYWDAPSEAEAECANMLRHGIVDAIWSEDSDVFLFRAENVLRFHHPESGQKDKPGKKDNVMAMKYSMSSIKEKFPNMDWRDVLLFAVLVGGDYAVGGLRGCGPKLAVEAISKGFGKSLVDQFKRGNLPKWRELFQTFLDTRRAKISMPDDFPSDQVLQQYIQPQVSTPEELKAKLCWDLPINHTTLRQIITSRFNFSVQEYIRWVVRMLVARRLQAGPGSSVDDMELEFVRGVSTKESGNIDLSRISFLLSSIVPDRTLLDTWPVKDTIDKSRIKDYVHQDRVEYDIPDSIINFASPDLLKSKEAHKPKVAIFEAKKDTHRPARGRYEQASRGTSREASGQSSLKRKRGNPRKDEASSEPARSVSRRDKGAARNATRAREFLIPRNFDDEEVEDDEDDDDFPDISELGRGRSSKASFGVQRGHRKPRQREVLAEVEANLTPKTKTVTWREKQATPVVGQSRSHPIELDD